MSSVAVPPVSNIVCFICSKSFLRTEHLTRHFRTHTDEKSYFCEVCGKGFSRSDILARHKNAHQLDDARRISSHNSQTIFRACYGCATARVKCSGSTPCQRCIVKRHECCYPVVQIKKLKTKKRPKGRQYSDTDGGNQILVDEISRDSSIIPDLHTNSLAADYFAEPNTELGKCQVKNCRPQHSSTACENQQTIKSSFNIYSLNSGITPPSENEKLQSWMQDSQCLSPEMYDRSFVKFATTIHSALPVNASQSFADGPSKQEQLPIDWLPPSECSNFDFSYGSQQCSDGIMGGNIPLGFDWETMLNAGESSTYQQHQIYRTQRNGTIVGISPSLSLGSIPAQNSLLGRYQSPASSISDVPGAFHYEVDDTQQMKFQADWENNLVRQASLPLKCYSPALLHAPVVAIDHSLTAYIITEGKQFTHYRRYFSNKSNHSTSPSFPSPQPSTKWQNKQHHIPITVEKQVLEHSSSRIIHNVIPTPVYTTLMIQFKKHCLKHQQPFLSDYFPSVVVLELSVALYTEHFGGVFPLLGKSDFNFRESICEENSGGDTHEALLLLAICAIGVAYLGTDEAWLCSEAFLEFLQRMLNQAGPSSPSLGTEHTSATVFRNSGADMIRLQSRILSVVAMFRSPNQILVEQAFEGRKKLVSVLRSGVLSEKSKAYGEDNLSDAKKRAACCIWWLDSMMAQQPNNFSNFS